MPTKVQAVGRADVPPLTMSDRFRHEIAYFMSVPGKDGVPVMPAGEYFIDELAARQWLENGVIRVVSPLDGEHQTEMDLTEEQEAFLEWTVENNVRHVRLVAQ